MPSTVASIAISGVRSSCATSEVRRCSNLISRSNSDAIESNVSPKRPISSSPVKLVRAVRSPLRICAAVDVIFLIGFTNTCDAAYDKAHANKIAITAAARIAP